MVKEAVGALLFVVFATGVVHRVKAYRGGDRFDRRNEGWAPLILIRLFGLATAVSVWRAFAQAGDEASNWLGVAVTAAGSVLLVSMFVALGHNLTDTVQTRASAQFVRHGPYRFIRNPMYTGILVFSTGLGLALNSVWVAIFGTATFAMLAIRTRTEEKVLRARFGAQYESYVHEVGRFFPRITPDGDRAATKFR
ncbi:MAG: isoprenylcysteine carboxylmethyltransferase family protein [Acidobacteria bacterium]|nr:isoprenylcysteine carboxylmethyltransferase family protein [Acidobacteriota bacterium]